MFVLSSDETLAVLTAAFLGGALFGRIVWRRRAYEAMLAAANVELEHRVEQRTVELEEARERYRLLAEHASDMISTHELDGTYTYAAPALEELLGQTTEQLRNVSITHFAADDDKMLIGQAWERAARYRGAALVTWRCRRSDGSYVWLETSGRAVRDPQTGAAKWLVCASRDVTGRKRIEEALRESERRLRATLETSNLVAVALDMDGVITFCNEGLCALTGWGRDALLGHNWFDVCMRDRAVRRAFQSRIRRGTIPARFDAEIVCRDGTRRLVAWDNNIMRDPSGALLGTVSLGADVTEKRQEETALQLLQTVTIAAGSAEDIDVALGAMLESICEAMRWRYGEAWLLDAAEEHLVRQEVVYVAPGMDASTLIESGRGLELRRGEGLPGQVWKEGAPAWLPRMDEDLTRPRRRIAVAAGMHAALAVPVMSGHQVTAVLVFFLGSVKRRDERGAEVVSMVAKQLGSMILRKRAETELHESEARLRAIVQSLKEGLIITDLDDRIQFVNERTLELTGMSEQQLVGRTAADLLALTNRDDTPADRLARRARGLTDRYEVRLARAGGPERWLEITGGPLANAEGEIVGVVATLVDVSERRRYEEELLGARDAAEGASRAKSGFLSRMSHELRTPLNSVIGFARVLRRNGATRFQAQDLQYLDRIQANGEHLLKLVNDVLDVSRIEAGRVTVESGPVQLDAIVREVVEQLEGQPRAAGVVLRADVPSAPVVMETDPRLLRQVLINLVGNAIRFTHHGHVLVRLVLDAATQRPQRIDVVDTGIGIPADRQRAIFEPFEQADSTTTRAYGGTGLGLSIARSFCDALGYDLSVDSAPGKGSTFSIRLTGNARRTGEAA